MPATESRTQIPKQRNNCFSVWGKQFYRGLKLIYSLTNLEPIFPVHFHAKTSAFVRWSFWLISGADTFWSVSECALIWPNSLWSDNRWSSFHKAMCQPKVFFQIETPDALLKTPSWVRQSALGTQHFFIWDTLVASGGHDLEYWQK